MYKKTVPILFIAIALIVGACSHSSNERSSTPNSFGTELIISPTLVTLSDAEWQRVTAERDKVIEEFGNSSSANLEFLPTYTFSPGTPEWNTAVIREAEEHKESIITYNNCSSIDDYYDFEKFSVGPIEKLAEISLRYDSDSSIIITWEVIENLNLRTNSSLTSFDSEEAQADLQSRPKEEREGLENLRQFYEEVRATLADIIGNTSLRSVIESFTHTTLPLLVEDLASIGIKSGESAPSKFQDIWEANPELEKYARVSVGVYERLEVGLTEFLNENDIITLAAYSEVIQSLADISDAYPSEEDLPDLSKVTESIDFLEPKQPPVGCPESDPASRSPFRS